MFKVKNGRNIVETVEGSYKLNFDQLVDTHCTQN